MHPRGGPKSYSYASSELDRISSSIRNNYDSPSAIGNVNANKEQGTMSFQRGNTKVLIHSSGDVEIETKNVDEPKLFQTINSYPTPRPNHRLQFDSSHSQQEYLATRDKIVEEISPDTSYNSKLKSSIFDSGRAMESKSTAASVVGAFKDLQEKLKALETERTSALEERDNLRREIGDVKMKQEIMRSKLKLEHDEEILTLRVSNDHAKFHNSELQERIERQVGIENNIQASINNQKTKFTSIQNELFTLNLNISNLENQLQQLTNELLESRKREEQLIALSTTTSPGSFGQNLLDGEGIEELTHRIYIEKQTTKRAKYRAEALDRYLRMILKINGDLCDTITTRERARARLAHLSASYSHHHLPTSKKSNINTSYKKYIPSSFTQPLSSYDIYSHTKPSTVHNMNPFAYPPSRTNDMEIHPDYYSDPHPVHGFNHNMSTYASAPRQPTSRERNRDESDDDDDVAPDAEAADIDDRPLHHDHINTNNGGNGNDNGNQDQDDEIDIDGIEIEPHYISSQSSRPHSAPLRCSVSDPVIRSSFPYPSSHEPTYSMNDHSNIPYATYLQQRAGGNEYVSNKVERNKLVSGSTRSTSPIQSNVGSISCKRAFIPSGLHTDKDFNIVASVSRASRAAHNLNASLSARYGLRFVLLYAIC